MLIQGLTLTIIGMLVVFSILVLLVFVMKLLSAIVFRFFPEPEEPLTHQGSSGNPEIAVALAAAYARQKQ